MKHNFFQHNKVGVALVPQSVTNTTVNGATITEPWKLGRQISFIALGGAFAATVDGELKLQGQRRSDSGWEDLKEVDGTTVLRFTDTLLDDGGALENGAALGTLEMKRVDATTYKALRLVFTEAGNAAALVGAAYVISELLEMDSNATDELRDKQRTA